MVDLVDQAGRLDRRRQVRRQRSEQRAILGGQRLLRMGALGHGEHGTDLSLDLHREQVPGPRYGLERARLDGDEGRGTQVGHCLLVQIERHAGLGGRHHGEARRAGPHQHLRARHAQRLPDPGLEPVDQTREVGVGVELPGPVQQRGAVAVALAVEHLVHADAHHHAQLGIGDRHGEQSDVAGRASRQVEQIGDPLAEHEDRHRVDGEGAEDRGDLGESADQDQIQVVEPVTRQGGGEGGRDEQQRHHGDQLRPVGEIGRTERPGHHVQQDERPEPEGQPPQKPAHLGPVKRGGGALMRLEQQRDRQRHGGG